MAADFCKASAKPENRTIKWRVRPMRREDIPKCLKIWLQVELCEGEQTVASALASDPGGFYVAELMTTGEAVEVVGMCAGILASKETAFMGFYAVEPKYQGLGIGRELWAITTERLDESTNIGLYGVPVMSEKYKKSGFKMEDSTRMLIFESKPSQELALERLLDFENLRLVYRNETLEMLMIDSNSSELIFQKIVDYDQNVNKFSREKLLRHYILNGSDIPLTLAVARKKGTAHNSECCCIQAGGATTSPDEDTKLSCKMGASLSLASSNQVDASDVEILGYGCIRLDNTDGAMVGPIYADSKQVCEVILRNLIERFELPAEGKYSIMSLTSNNEASEILERIGLQEMDQCSRMFTKFVPEASYCNIFYVHSPNFSLF